MPQRAWLVVGLAIAATALGAATPSVDILAVPEWGTHGTLSGAAAGVVPADYRVAALIFVPDNGWYSKPTCAQRLIPLTDDGTFGVPIGHWNVTDRTATAYAAYLVPAHFDLACVNGSAEIPAALEQAAAARARLRRPDPNPFTLEFSGFTWTLKSSGDPRDPVLLGPGPNVFSADPAHVWVDDGGRLHMRIARCGAGWCSVELVTRDQIAYGTLRVVLDSPVDALDPNAVFGLFTWSYDAGPYNREMDIEFGRWGSARTPFNAQYVVQPSSAKGNVARFSMPPVPFSTHILDWESGRAGFRSHLGWGTSGALLHQWEFSDPWQVPVFGRTQFHLNFYLAGGKPPLSGEPQEVVISRFEYIPRVPLLSISPTTMTVSAAGGALTAGVAATDAGCVWSAETEATWLHIRNASLWEGPGSIQIEADVNPGAARTANVAIESRNCALAIGEQRLAVTQLAAESK